MAPIDLNGSRIIYKMLILPFFGGLANIPRAESLDRRFDDITKSRSENSTRSRGSRYAPSQLSDDDY